MKKATLCIAGIALISGWVLAGCGDDDNGEGGVTLSCEVTPCGGDVVGAWTFQDAMVCGDLGESDPDCPDMTMQVNNMNMTGTITINSDGTYSLDMSMSMDLTITNPLDCLGGLTDCSLLEDNESLDDATCISVTDACECSGIMTNADAETGTWTTDANILTMTSDDPEPGDEPTELSYCLSGDEAVMFDDERAVKLTR